MISNQKARLIETWYFRAHLHFFVNGIKNIIKNKRFLIGSLIYWVILIIIRKIILINNNPTTFGQAFFITLFAIITFAGFVLFQGKPSGAGRAMRNFIRIGLVNHAGECPLLIECRIENGVYYLKFKNCGISIDKWNDNKTQIESGLNLHIEDIKESGKKQIIVKAVSGDIILPDFIEWDDSYLSYENFELVLGESYTGPVKINLGNTPHTLIGGSTGSGKTILLKNLLFQCLKKNALVKIADFKGGVDFSKAWHEKCAFVTEKNSLINVLNDLVAELHRRKELFANSDCANIDEYNKKYHSNLQRVIFACDEVAEITDTTGMTKQQKNEVAIIVSLISTIARLGRAFGISLILATQRSSVDLIPGGIKNNLDVRCAGRCDSNLSLLILDKSDAADLISKNSQGRFLTNDDVLFQAYWFDDSKL